MQYKIIQDSFDEQSFNNPIDRSITDLLTDRTRGFSLDIIETPIEDFSDLTKVMFELALPPQFAFNQGPTNYNFLVLLNSPEKIRTGEGPTYVLDNAFDYKDFFVVSKNTSYWGQREKAGSSYLYLGDADEAIEEFRQQGFNFIKKIFEPNFDRLSKVNEILERQKNP